MGDVVVVIADAGANEGDKETEAEREEGGGGDDDEESCGRVGSDTMVTTQKTGTMLSARQSDLALTTVERHSVGWAEKGETHTAAAARQ